MDFTIVSGGVTRLTTVTTDGARLYALFGVGSDAALPVFERARESFTTLTAGNASQDTKW